jgi:hypothetical protein
MKVSDTPASTAEISAIAEVTTSAPLVSASNPENRPPHLWKPGQSGNPSGRPKGLTAIMRAYQAAEPEARERLLQLMRSEDGNVALKAAQYVIDRAYGKPVQAVSGPDGSEPIKLDVRALLQSLIRLESK